MDVHEYKANKYRNLSLPSGLEIKIKDISPYTALLIQSNVSSADGILADPRGIAELFKNYIVDPKIPDEMGMEDFTSNDYNYIYFKIFDQIRIRRLEEIKDVVSKNKDFS